MTQNEQSAEQSADTSEQPGTAEKVHHVSRTTLIKDLLVFQFKLALDGIRDLLLSPVSIITGLFDIVFGGDGKHFYALLRWGHKTDRWISLFSAADNKMPSLPGVSKPGELTTDSIVNYIEKVMQDELKRGKLVSQSRQTLDDLVERLRK